MKFIKRILFLLVTLAMLTIALLGCGGTSDTETEAETKAETSTKTPTTAPETETEAETENETETETEPEAETKGELEYVCVWNGHDVGYAVTGIGTYTDATLVIPAKYNGSPVTSIGGWAFSGCTGLTSVTIPDSVTRIEECAFYDCSGLTSVTIPNSVTGIGEQAFYDCTGLTSVEIPPSVTVIGESAFSNTNLTAVYITDIASWCSINYFPHSCEVEGSSPMTNAPDLYLNGELITSLILPDGMTSIGSGAFYNCQSLTSIEIPDGVTSIGSYAFSGCTGLTSITIPNSVTSIGDYAFASCDSLANIVFNGTKAQWQSVENGEGCLQGFKGNVLFDSDLLFTLSEDGNGYLVTGIGSCTDTDLVIPSEYRNKPVIGIGKNAFFRQSSLTSVIIPDSVTSIGVSAFAGCVGLTSITIPDGVTEIGYTAFYGCTSLTSITISDSVTSIGYNAFLDCSNLTSVTMGRGIAEIGAGTFEGCSSLTRVDVADIASWCGIDFGDGLANPLYYAHELYVNGERIDSLVIPEGVTNIKAFAFIACTGLTNIEIPSSVSSISKYAFYECSGLTDINFTGTIEQWNAISKGGNWDSDTGSYTVHCTDGDIRP